MRDMVSVEEFGLGRGGMHRRKFMVGAATVGVASLALATGKGSLVQAAQIYPEKMLKMIHAFSAGSGTDACGRLLSEGLSRDLHQSVVVENRPGASMAIGTAYAAKQPADGYTLLMVTLDSLGINPVLYPHIGYKIEDFDPVTLVGQIPLVLIGAPSSPYSNFDTLLKAAITEKKELTMGTWGYGSVGHVVGVLITQKTPLKFEFAPFQGAAPAAQAVMGGHVDTTLITPQSAIDIVKTGRAKAFAIGGELRHPELPGVPTFKELGFPEVKSMQWHGVAVRAGGNKEIIDRLYAGCQKVFKDNDLSQKILQVGYTKIDARGPDEFGKFIRAEAESWGKLVKNSIPLINK